ncbi:phosphonate C-P lyase system protein PhnH [Clostridium sp.]|uniref:phosphonate C-P lyase system protein PhnH n=1 Tax=Clostridium sp. TaxID=1506 RepID=UPI003D6C8F96
MKLDLVHDIQSSYRKTLNCMARPGIIENIKEESEKIDIDVNFYKSTMVLMLMLLDGEVSYKIITDKEEEVINVVNQMTFSNSAGTKDADFIFILRDASPEVVEGAFRNAKTGDLVNPHKSAIIIFETDGLSNEQELALIGPGIEHTNYVKIQTKASWIQERDKINVEYPIGIDFIFTDSSSNIMCLPRTTQVSKQVV